MAVWVNFSLMLCKAKHSCNLTFHRDFHGVPLQSLHLFCAHVGSTMHFPSWEPIWNPAALQSLSFMVEPNGASHYFYTLYCWLNEIAQELKKIIRRLKPIVPIWTLPVCDTKKFQCLMWTQFHWVLGARAFLWFSNLTKTHLQKNQLKRENMKEC